jgi:hypothetical protein
VGGAGGIGPAGAATAPSGLDRPANGAAALRAVGADLPATAAANGMSAQRLKALLSGDPSMWLDRGGRLFAIDPAPAAASLARSAAAAVAAAAPFPYAQTFTLHSRPGSKHTLYLDFVGATVSGTAWNSQGLPAGFYPPFDTDGAPGTFSTGEQDLIQSVWQRVSEDYQPFDVDVTTQDPGTDALLRTSSADLTFGSRALISPSASARTTLCGGCGGVAFVGTFNGVGNARYQPAWIFPQALGNNAKAIAEAVSHEVGHNLGLSHDGVTGGSAYYTGQGAWAPIMGVGYNKPIVQWSKGEYAGANNREDDLAVIAAHGAPVRTDDHGNAASTATFLGSWTTLSRAGVITSSSDTDWFSFSTTCTGPATMTVGPAPNSPDLDAELTLYNAAGTALGVANPASAQVSTDVASGLSAGLTGSLAPGTYYLRVRGVGAGTPATTGYSNYASLGRYEIRAKTVGSGCPPR